MLDVKYYSNESCVNTYAHEASIKALPILLEESTLTPISACNVLGQLTHSFSPLWGKETPLMTEPQGETCSERAQSMSQHRFCYDLVLRLVRSNRWGVAYPISPSPGWPMELGNDGEQQRPRGALGGPAACDRLPQEHMPHAACTQKEVA